MAQRLVRAKRKIRDAQIPYEVPAAGAVRRAAGSVLATLYLIFNEGYLASGADSLVRGELCAEAIRLARVLVEVMPGEPEVTALLALMLLHDARRAARTDATGELVLLADQDRSLWDRERIAEGLELADGAGPAGPRPVRAPGRDRRRARPRRRPPPTPTGRGSSASTAGSPSSSPSPVVELNRAVAVAMADGPEAAWR